MHPLEDAIASARSELRARSLRDIQVATAYAWTGRAVAAAERFAANRSTQWLLDTQEYVHEALEHAVLAGEPVLTEVRSVLLTHVTPILDRAASPAGTT